MQGICNDRVQLEMEIRTISRRRPRFVDDTEFGHFTLLFCGRRQRNVQRFITRVHSYCLATFSLPSSSWFSSAPSTLIRFETKTELFCSVFKKNCVHAYDFRIVFARTHCNTVSVLKTLLYTQCACSNELNACAF